MQLKNANILIVDDDPDVITAVKLLLKTEVKGIDTDRNPANLPSLLATHDYDLMLLDMNFTGSVNTGNEGIYWLRRCREIKPNACIIMITAYGDIDLAVRSLKEGAADFVVKPWHNEKLIATMKDVLGDSVALALDCGPGWMVPDAIRFAKAVERLNILWCEDMITGDYTPYTLADVYREVTQATSTPIHTGESAQQNGRIRHCARHRSRRVLAGGNRDDARTAHQPERRLDPHNSAE